MSWKSPLLNDLRHLRRPGDTSTVRKYGAEPLSWLDALDEMQRLKTLVLHSACQIAPSYLFDVERNPPER